MSPDAKKVLELGLALNEGDREWVGHHLLDSVPAADAELSREAWERAWMEEVDRRWKAYERGEAQAIPGDEVMARLKAKYP